MHRRPEELNEKCSSTVKMQLLRSSKPSPVQMRAPVASGPAPMTPSAASGRYSDSASPYIVRSQSAPPIQSTGGNWSGRVRVRRKAGERLAIAPHLPRLKEWFYRLPLMRSPTTAHRPIPRWCPALATDEDQLVRPSSPGPIAAQFVPLQESIKIEKERQPAVVVKNHRYDPGTRAGWVC